MKVIRTFRWRLGVVTLATCVVASCIPVNSASADQRAPFFRSVSHLEWALRRAVEDQPEGLLKSLAASERICELGQFAEGQDEDDAAAADWRTLTQAIGILDEPALQGVTRAFGQAESSLDAVERQYRSAWSQEPSRARKLRSGARIARNGIHRVILGVEDLRSAFHAWGDHNCEAALASTDMSNEAISAGVGLIVQGMEQLWLITVEAG